MHYIIHVKQVSGSSINVNDDALHLFLHMENQNKVDPPSGARPES
jgi:hypothetical protein